MSEAPRQSTLADRIRDRMEVLSLNPYSAATKAGLGADFVRDILRGKVKNPSAERLGKLAAALECSLNYLLGVGEVEIRRVDSSGAEIEAPPPPPPAPAWEPRFGMPGANLLPIKFELIADAWRPAAEVVRRPLGYEATTVPVGVRDRDFWWEAVRDQSMRGVAPEGSLVLVTEYRDDERDQIEDGALVIIQRRLIGPDSAFNLVERSMRRVRYRYPDLGLWFLEYATGDTEFDLTDDVWRQTAPTAPRRSLTELADEIEDPKERERAHHFNEIIEAARRANAERSAEERAERMRRIDEALENADKIQEAHQKWKSRLVGKVLRILIPVSPGAGDWNRAAKN